MGSEQFTRNVGLKRAAEPGQGYPEIFTVIGVDISAADLIAKYKGTRGEQYAIDVINAVVQEQRTKGPPPASFVRTLRGGVRTPISVCDLNADASGKSWMVVVAGRQRDIGLRIVNEEADAAGHPKMMIPVTFAPFSRKTAGLDAAMAKVVENARVPRATSQRAEDAADLSRRHVAPEDISALVEARDIVEVMQLLALSDCCDEVREAVDAGTVALATCVDLAKHSHEEQARRVARKAAPTKEAREAAKKTRVRPHPKALAKLDRALSTVIRSDADTAFMLGIRHALGQDVRGYEQLPPGVLALLTDQAWPETGAAK